jgi:hypothetical protein
MAVDVGKLKRGMASATKGTPPTAEEAKDVVAENVRPEEVIQRPLQVRVPASVFEEFSERAGREFGFTHGSKKQLFLKMWDAYKAQSM